jgi:hypothetical protein
MQHLATQLVIKEKLRFKVSSVDYTGSSYDRVSQLTSFSGK